MPRHLFAQQQLLALVSARRPNRSQCLAQSGSPSSTLPSSIGALAATAASSGADLLGGNLVRTLAELCGGKQYTLVLIDSAGDTALLEIPPGQLEILARANPQTTALPWTWSEAACWPASTDKAAAVERRPRPRDRRRRGRRAPSEFRPRGGGPVPCGGHGLPCIRGERGDFQGSGSH